MKKQFLMTAALASAIGISCATTAMGQGNSEPGLARYIDNQGRQQATEVGAQCDSGAGSGAFGFLGKDLNPGDPVWDGGNGTEPGTSGILTGLNNSAVCGNRQFPN